ncbi:hypothetical protein Franean1_3022 [Parafrankia sp. EAN1pec]|nr:hypothetical protein Franean1_3022 [Frankia sp. EAN1pec]
MIKSATSEIRASAAGYITDELLAFYEPIVRAQTPLIVTDNLYVSLQAKSTPKQAGIDVDAKLPGLRDWVTMTHESGGLLFAQLNLVTRDEARLQAVAHQLTADHGVEVLAADLSDPHSRRRVEKRLTGGPFIDLLVNNAGILHSARSV